MTEKRSSKYTELQIKRKHTLCANVLTTGRQMEHENITPSGTPVPHYVCPVIRMSSSGENDAQNALVNFPRR